jgi:hypothetical protein
VDDLAPDVFEIRVSPQGDLISTSTDPENDNTSCPLYPSLGSVQAPDGVQTISRSELEEIDRLGPLVDLVRCRCYASFNKKVSTRIRVGERSTDQDAVCIQILLHHTAFVLCIARNGFVDAITKTCAYCTL